MPWDEILRFGVTVLRLSPEAVWRLSPRELRPFLLCDPPAVLDRAAFEALRARFDP